MDISTILSRLQFAFTIAFHYIFPQFTMGLALLLLILKSLYLLRKDELYNKSARFWGKIFAVTFIMGVVTGIPMEFQFGTNWARFSVYAGDIIAQTLAMEGAFAFFLESAFLGIFLFGENVFGQKMHWFSSLMVWLGTWASGGFIVASNAWMQHPVGYTMAANGRLHIDNYWAVLFNPWIGPQYSHTMGGAVITASFVMAGLGAYYLLAKQHIDYARLFITVGVIVGFIASAIQLFPTGDLEGRQVATYQPAKLAAMEGLFQTESGAGVVILGQPDTPRSQLDNPIIVPNVLSFLTYRRWTAQVKGMDAFSPDQLPDSIELLYYSYHIMVGLGTFFIAIMGLSLFLLWRKLLFQSRWMLWILMLAAPFPFISNIAGWFTTELGRQPWLVFGMLRTAQGSSINLSAGNVLFTLIGFAGMYLLLGLLYVVLVVTEAVRGPVFEEEAPPKSRRISGPEGSIEKGFEEKMQTLWFILVAFMLSMYVLLDGFDLGAGVLHLFVARTNEERRMILNAIGPVWDGNEVWLIAAGGTLFFSFPVLYAASFSGFYLPLIIVLWLLMLRGVSIELRGHIHNPVWFAFWDGIFFIGSALLTIFYGAAMANVLRGVPLDSTGTFFEGLWTNFNPFSANPGILDWYTVLIGLLALATLTTHGANYIVVKTEGDLYNRTRRVVRVTWLVTVVLAVLGTIASFIVQPHISMSYFSRPWGFIFPVITLVGLAGSGYFYFKQQDLYTFLAFGLYIVGMLLSAAFGLYPLVLPASDHVNNLTIYNASASQYGQAVGLVWWIIGMILAVIYFIFAYRLFWGKVQVKETEGY